MPICIIHNPHAGRRRAGHRLRQLHRHWEGQADFWPTERIGHGRELAQKAVEQGYTTVVAAGGDGTVHEVANGLLSSGEHDVIMAIVPVGSANDYAYSLQQQFGISALDDDVMHSVDVGQITTPDGRDRYFVESAGIGLPGMVTHESRGIDRSQGLILYGRAAWRALGRDDLISKLQLRFDDEEYKEWPTLLLSLLLGQREGNFKFAPQASLDDGLFDVVHAGALTRWQILPLLPRLALSGPPTNNPQIHLRQCQSLRVSTEVPLTIHTDGELFCLPADEVKEVSILLLPKRLRVKVCKV